MHSNSNEDEAPKTQTETSRSAGGGRFPPRRTAIGTDDEDAPVYEPGEQLECKITGFRKGGFEVLILRDSISAFLKSTEKRRVGEIVIVQFHKWQDRGR